MRRRYATNIPAIHRRLVICGLVVTGPWWGIAMNGDRAIGRHRVRRIAGSSRPEGTSGTGMLSPSRATIGRVTSATITGGMIADMTAGDRATGAEVSG